MVLSKRQLSGLRTGTLIGAVIYAGDVYTHRIFRTTTNARAWVESHILRFHGTHADLFDGVGTLETFVPGNATLGFGNWTSCEF